MRKSDSKKKRNYKIVSQSPSYLECVFLCIGFIEGLFGSGEFVERNVVADFAVQVELFGHGVELLRQLWGQGQASEDSACFVERIHAKGGGRWV